TYGDRDEYVSCFLGVSDHPAPVMDDGLRLISDDKFPFIARCTVEYNDGKITFLECILPTT
ncbi:MAG: hypothetical protein IJ719_10295, partial [Clostridia bacterium]|nr:hypothetical protein [Clostridia bacterium]